MPSHNHPFNINHSPWVQGPTYGNINPSSSSGANCADISAVSIGNTGGNSAHNNMPPYLSVYMWKRTS